MCRKARVMATNSASQNWRLPNEWSESKRRPFQNTDKPKTLPHDDVTLRKIQLCLPVATLKYRNTATFKKTFEDSHSPHLTIWNFEPNARCYPFCTTCILALGEFWSVIFMDKSTYHLPSDLGEIARVSTPNSNNDRSVAQMSFS